MIEIENVKSIYARKFDKSSPMWEEDARFNEHFLKSAELYFNDVLKNRGYVFLRDIYEKIGIPIDSKSIVVGWFYDLEKAFVDNYVSIEIEQIGDSPDFILDFNVDGSIVNHFE